MGFNISDLDKEVTMDSESIAQSGYNCDFNISIHVINSLTRRVRSCGEIFYQQNFDEFHTILCIVILLVLKPKTKMLLLFKYT